MSGVLVAALLVLAGTASARAVETSTGHGRVEHDAPDPVRVRAAAVDIAAPTIPLGKRDDGRLEVPDDAEVAGWWTGRATPGERGPAVIAGHVDSRRGPGAFWELGDLEVGDRVTVDREDGSSLHWRVERVEQHPKDDFPTQAVYGDTDEPTLRLITCSGHFDPRARSYRDNTIVFLALDPIQEAVATASVSGAVTGPVDGPGSGSAATAEVSPPGPGEGTRQPSAHRAARPSAAGVAGGARRSRVLPIALAVASLLTASGAVWCAWPSRG